jgi:hypothetical protein
MISVPLVGRPVSELEEVSPVTLETVSLAVSELVFDEVSPEVPELVSCNDSEPVPPPLTQEDKIRTAAISNKRLFFIDQFS